eukprot:TRINITY_DN63503_c0_g1_i1.p1 TRINITY_DN63503_c0_g1~~TRINITY_DN63503_c0_g1_i1.p1  ORF type:complete len:316 (-),score=60.36 TRINITY_DN63503_c0_g1_i1:252-1199(-)
MAAPESAVGACGRSFAADWLCFSWLPCLPCPRIPGATSGPDAPVAAPLGDCTSWHPLAHSDPYVEPCALERPMRSPPLRVQSGALLNLCDEGLVSAAQLAEVLKSFGRGFRGFRRFGQRKILDFKFAGSRGYRLRPPFDVLNPVLEALIEIAEASLRQGETLALVQLLVNYYKFGFNAVKEHRHRCRQVCCSLGAARDVEVEGRRLRMAHGDCLPLDRELHGVPPAQGGSAGSRLSLCLFYASASEFAAGAVGVPAKGPMWWSHPEDAPREAKPTPECRDFQRGRCSRGGQCKYLHTANDAARHLRPENSGLLED